MAQTVSPEFARINQTLHAFARDHAADRFTQAKVDDAEQAFIGALQQGRLDPADYRRVVNSPNRYAEAVRWHQRQVASAEIGDDPSAFKARVEAELREKILAELRRAGAALRSCHALQPRRRPQRGRPQRPGLVRSRITHRHLRSQAAGLGLPVVAQPLPRHCERSEAIQRARSAQNKGAASASSSHWIA